MGELSSSARLVEIISMKSAQHGKLMQPLISLSCGRCQVPCLPSARSLNGRVTVMVVVYSLKSDCGGANRLFASRSNLSSLTLQATNALLSPFRSHLDSVLMIERWSPC